MQWLGFGFMAMAWGMGTMPAIASADRQGLEGLVKRYWAAEVDQNYGAVYDMLEAREQDPIPRQDYIEVRKGGGPARYLTAEVVELAYDGDLAWVYVTFDWVFSHYPNASPRPGYAWQPWRYADGWHPVPLLEREQWPSLPPKLRSAADEAVLKERVIGLWQAKTSEDWKSVYVYMPPWFRDRVSLEKFLGNKALYVYLSPEVEWVEAKGDQGRAKVTVATRHNDPAATKMKPQTDRFVESWIKVNGTWYLKVPPPEETAQPVTEGVKGDFGAQR
jgi:hypothetical protein